MNPGDFRFTDAAAVEQLARILREAITRAKASRRRGGQHSAPRLELADVERRAP